MPSRVKVFITHPTFGKIEIKSPGQISQEKVRQAIIYATVLAMEEVASFVKEKVEERFETAMSSVLHPFSTGETTTRLRDAYVTAIAQDFQQSGNGIRVGFFNLGILDKLTTEDRGDTKFSWWQLHEFGSPLLSNYGFKNVPLSKNLTRFGGSRTHGFVPKEGEGKTGKGFMVPIAGTSREPHPGIVPIRAIGYVKPLAQQKMKEVIRQKFVNTFYGVLM